MKVRRTWAPNRVHKSSGVTSRATIIPYPAEANSNAGCEAKSPERRDIFRWGFLLFEVMNS